MSELNTTQDAPLMSFLPSSHFFLYFPTKHLYTQQNNINILKVPNMNTKKISDFETPNAFSHLETLHDEEDDNVEITETGEGNAVISSSDVVEQSSVTMRDSCRPPTDDCCPVCFSDFSVACKAQCGHWFCGSCILQVWNYSAAYKPCKCPMCTRPITKLSPEQSLYQLQEREVVEVLKQVERYNRIFVGGICGAFRKFREFPLFMKRLFVAMMDPDRPYSYISEMRLLAMIMTVVYMATPFDFIPTGGLGIARVFDYGAIILVVVLRLVGLYRRWQLTRRVRQLAVAET